MNGIISGNMVGGAAPLRTLILTDADGNEFTGVVTGQEVVFTATDNDVREGLVYASDEGISTGTKNIPGYRTTQGVALVLNNSEFSIPLSQYDQYDYTELQCIIAPLESNATDSVASEKIVLYDAVYETNTSEPISELSKDSENKSINLNITNNTGNMYVIHYFTYREED